DKSYLLRQLLARQQLPEKGPLEIQKKQQNKRAA
ncbi:uncharacterized protein METZ01_LOCUS294355, partial [marine metagenome]